MKTSIYNFFIVFIICTTFVNAQSPSGIHVHTHDEPLPIGQDNTITIEESFGKQIGVNLFHTFNEFGIEQGQTAFFKKETANIQNVISRVIGGEHSFIDGTIKTNFQNFYFLNPAGVIFGPHANLDVAGSFHVSTADYIRGEKHTFGTDTDTDLSDSSNFFVDHPVAFGFLDDNMGSIIDGFGRIEFQGIGEYDPNIEAPGLSVNAEQTISLIGGDIEFKQGAYYYDENNKLVNSGTLYANAGRINLASVKSDHEIPLQHIFKVDSIANMNKISGAHEGDIAIVSNNGQKTTYQVNQVNESKQWIETQDLTTIPGTKIGHIDSQAEMGRIDAKDQTRLSVDQFTMSSKYDYEYQNRSGEIIIKGGNIFLDKTKILAQNSSDEPGGNIEIYGDSIELNNNTFISTVVSKDQKTVHILDSDSGINDGSETINLNRGGHGGNIIIEGHNGQYAESVSLYGSIIESGTQSLNKNAASGHIHIKSHYLTLLSYEQESDGSKVSSSIYSNVNGYGQGGDIRLDIPDSVNIMAGSQIYANALNQEENAGNAGTIDIKARTIIIKDTNSEISSQTVGPGEGGYISLQAEDHITMMNFATIKAENGSNQVSSIDNGNAGDIFLSAPYISLLEGSKIESSTYVKVSDKVNKGRAGNITLRADNLIYISGADVVDADASSIRNRSLNTDPNAANGGKVKLYANKIKFEDGAFIGSETFGGGNGGDVLLDANDSIQFSGTESAGYACKIYTTSSKTEGNPNDVGKAGNITLEADNLIQLKDGAGVTASTMGPGEGGSVIVQHTKKLEISGGNPHGENEDGFASGLFARAEGQGRIAGNAKKIDIFEVEEVVITDGGVISTSTLGAGDAGEIHLNLGAKLTISGQAELVSEDNYLQSQNNYARMYNVKGDYRSGIYSSSENEESYAGDAGKIFIAANSLSLDDYATISTSTKGKGKAGDIDLSRIGEIAIKNHATISSATSSQSNNLPDHLVSYVRGGDITKSDLSIYYIQTDLSKIINPQKGDIAVSSDSYYYYNGNAWVDVEMEQNILNVLNEQDLFNNLQNGDIYKFQNKQVTISYKKFNGTTWEPCNLNEINEFDAYYSVSDISQIKNPDTGDIAKIAKESELNNRFFRYDGTTWHAYDSNNNTSDLALNIYAVSDLSEISEQDNGDIAKISDSYYFYDGNTWEEIDRPSTNVLNILNQTSIFEGVGASDIYKYDIRYENNSFATSDTHNSHFIYDGNKWYEFDRDTLPMYQFRIFTVDDPNEIIPEKGDIVNIRNTDQYKYFYKQWHDLTTGELEPEEIPQLLNDKGVFDQYYLKGDRANFVYIDEKRTESYTFNDNNKWVKYTVDDFSSFLDKSDIDFDTNKKFNLVQDRSKYEMDYFYQDEWVKYKKAGDAGTIRIDTNDQLEISGEGTQINTATYGAGNAGIINIDSRRIQLTDFCEISSASHSQGSGGDAGTIKIMKLAIDETGYADHENWNQLLTINTNAKISTSTEGYGNAGNIEILSGKISMQSQGTIASSSNAIGQSGDAGNIIIHSDSLSLIHENTTVNTSTYGQGKAGNIDLKVNNLDLDQKASISSASNSIGKGGDAGVIRIGLDYKENTNPATKIDKPWNITNPSNQIRVTNESSISTASAGAGKAGIVLLGAKNIEVHQSASISSANSSVADIIYFKDSISQIGSVPKKIGSIVEVANDGTGNPKTYIYTGKGQHSGWEEKSRLTLNRVASMTELNGLNVNAGDIAKVDNAGDGYSKNFIFDGNDWQPIESDKTVQVHIRKTTDALSPNIDDDISAEKGDILYTTSNSGVYICEDNAWKPILWSSVLESTGEDSRQTAKDFQVTSLTDIPDDSNLVKEGDRANVTYTDGRTEYFVRVSNKKRASGAEWEKVSKAGNAGNINIIAEDEISLKSNGSLNTEAISSGGGKISIEGKDTLYLFQGLITASVQKGFGAGGDINTISNSVIMNHSGIEANAVEGDGGAIWIKTEQYIKSHDSYVTATSERGNDGTVEIDAPKVDISKGLVVLPTNFLDATRWVKTPCSLRSGESVSRLVLEGRDAIPTSLIDWQPSPPLGLTDTKKSDKKKKSSELNRPTLLKSKDRPTIKKDLTLNVH